ncbi:predicted protein [Plenodomus lingam JN3]|uniref:Predicted protein n=1 Tax=Leptosphaeria maculans (strain JN3 / isolate v23.1.3 / race Av1-4-5-6-7-8) TaxID=985895 RepID=E4ZWQ0_LEPMJ|nr:predicted protein [Plenodomus lingam JN3]CBX96026.1 predicted protein [Plenodomus lingam JN3]
MLPCQARVYFARPLVNRLAVAPSPLAGPPAHASLDGAAGEKMRPKKNGPLQYLAIPQPLEPPAHSATLTKVARDVADWHVDLVMEGRNTDAVPHQMYCG